MAKVNIAEVIKFRYFSTTGEATIEPYAYEAVLLETLLERTDFENAHEAGEVENLLYQIFELLFENATFDGEGDGKMIGTSMLTALMCVSRSVGTLEERAKTTT